VIRRRSSCFSPHPVCLMCLTAFLIAMSQPSKGCCCCLGDGFSAISPHWVLVGFFFSLVSSVLCIFATRESILSTKENAVQTLELACNMWFSSLLYPFFHTWNLHPMCSNDSILHIFQFPTYWICALLCLLFIFSSC
jgi:hypothetical protein